ncbi:MAG: hypothetical protein KC431_13510 [Myxococcales bacterium]|nr:hypothetical protein [Myxococcales bacterium]MCA9698539.1 hypothetical protein [Myxococcales bacterium]
MEALLYLERRREGYGERFEAEVDAVLERVHRFPKSGAKVPGFPPDVDVRAYPLRVFRYTLMVGFEGDSAVVYAVAHQQRRPGYWATRT